MDPLTTLTVFNNRKFRKQDWFVNVLFQEGYSDLNFLGSICGDNNDSKIDPASCGVKRGAQKKLMKGSKFFNLFRSSSG